MSPAVALRTASGIVAKLSGTMMALDVDLAGCTIITDDSRIVNVSAGANAVLFTTAPIKNKTVSD